jgi:hypothetical protein
MNWEALGAISEAIGVVAIFVSLVYVAVQIRQNTQQSSRNVEANQLAAFEQNIESGNRMRELLILHPEITQLLLTGFDSYENLQAAEKFRFGMLLRNIFSSIHGGYIRHLAVEHDPLEFQGSMNVLDEMLLNRGVREWLDTNEPDWRPEFRELVDLRLKVIDQRT